MTMLRFRRVAELWNWLPGFRGVAEHESLQAAASALNISPSALSRTVKLLESALGAPLFAREGAGLRLTPFGTELLTVTRNIMRQVDDCIAEEDRRRGGIGPLYVAATSEIASAVIARALANELDASGVIHVVRIEDDVIVDELLHGNVDLVVASAATRSASVASRRIGQIGFGVYAAASHPLAACRPVNSDQLRAATFVAVRDLPELADHSISVRCESIDLAVRLCEASARLCLLPDTGWPSLVRLAAAAEPIAVHVLQRPPLATGREDGRLAALVARLAAAVDGASREGADDAAIR